MRRPRPTVRYRDALAGHVPAEALSTAERWHLFRELTAAGWTVADIAAHTCTTEHTVRRIVERATP